MKVKTRFAPSPTGELHFGNIRTALFSWLFARKNSGKFILRFEDTDVNRNVLGSIEKIKKVMKWLGLNWDEKIYFQSKRLNYYYDIINFMLKKKIAYKCYCSEEILYKKKICQIKNHENTKYDGYCRNLKQNNFNCKKPYVVRFKSPKNGVISFEDAIRGLIKFKNKELDDFIIQRRNGIPTYNFCVVLDDLAMKITHVIRGEDHISNTPKQINILLSLNAHIPVYAHLPMLLDINKNKLSKKNFNTSIIKYFNEGFLPEAILNYLVRLGWSHGNKEIFSITEMKKLFSLEKVSKSSSIFDYKKLLWINKYYINNVSSKKIVFLLKYYMEKENINIKNGPNVKEVLKIFKSRYFTLKEIALSCRYLYEDIEDFKHLFLKKHYSKDSLKMLKIIYYSFKKIIHWNSIEIWESINSISLNNNISLKDIINFIRIIFTGKNNSPSISIIIYLIGKKRVLYNLICLIKILRKKLIF
ncbi:glutamate--tRNA ligase [Buchnera aphidicola (Ceratoglyphina bambusae)]|uniref:glutamate--tRNA ligase n=1 Tax=Buchnera aphidicola TaxID=9 RepID=UPI0031B80BDE